MSDFAIWIRCLDEKGDVTGYAEGWISEGQMMDALRCPGTVSVEVGHHPGPLADFREALRGHPFTQPPQSPPTS